MAYAVVAKRAGKSPMAKYVTLDEEDANAYRDEVNGGSRGNTYYEVETYDPNVHTGQPKMTPEAEAEIGPLNIAAGQLKRMADGYTDQAELDGEAK